jgi:hypothetical protein
MNNSPPKVTSGNPTDPTAVRLVVRYLGNIPAKKNSMYAGVNPKHQQWQRQCVAGFVSQLRSILATAATGTLTTPSLPSLIASLPPDDNWRVIPEIHAKAVACPPDEVGADILVEVIP